ncbi:MAG: mannitol-1-phosphate 5-dehydrogenase [Candidatus Infernicultor aquiphilus]|uniref:Mannitol-1-phosphate 5-dehydrogenase n=1 Tax=Candidatus Infernicultor aquiphilus TaxID=1805029 RepID=A0A2M7PQT5_9BACT|nr:MAG: mannitol-1-phosphate 5-dehydrogenase [Candidatus Atribacteria bacterium CG_4_10_14_3_um_filter_34_13]
MIYKKKMVQFGAGNIGRSFIGQLFSRSGYEVVFIDINKELVKELNKKRAYKLVIKRNELPDEIILIENIRAINGYDKEAVIREIVDTDILATAVGKNALPQIVPVIAQGLQWRDEKRRKNPLDIIIAENFRNVADYLRKELKSLLPLEYPFDELVGLIESSIGKMVPLMKEEDKKKDLLWIFAEPYNTLIVDKKGFKTPLPHLRDLRAVENIKAYVDRKLFIHNLGHSAAAYLGYQYDSKMTYIYEALELPEIYKIVREGMKQSAVALNEAYPKDLALQDLQNHIDDLLFRFQNKSLRDTIFRVGRDLYRKLDKNERLVGSMLLAQKQNVPYHKIKKVFYAALNFKAKDQKGEMYPLDKIFFQREYPRGLKHILKNVCHLSSHQDEEAKVREEIEKGNLI